MHDGQNLLDLGKTGFDDFLEILVGRHREQKGMEDSVEFCEPSYIRAGMGHQKETTVYGLELSNDKGNKLFRNDRAMLGGDELERVFLKLAQAVVKDIPRGHIMLMEGTYGFKVFLIRSE